MNKKILIIEDETSLQKALSEFLMEENFDVAAASDGEQGLILAKDENPDLILLDIILPKKDGYEVLAELKQDEKTKRIPVILLTNLESHEDIEKAFEKGASTYLVKSNYKMEDIVKKIKETLKLANSF
ncbi:MAG TPA: response regulator [Candidatus Moranbacteria bacterium]|nr:response regulator [Candidatus Moranbacteria bacterium]